MNKEEFINEFKKIDKIIDENIYEKLIKYKDLLIEWNEKFNLTTILKTQDIFLKHFFDSLMITKYVELNNKNICDFGTGAGFPGMVIAILFPKSSVTLLESNKKKTIFLEEVKNNLKLNNVNIINERAEIYGKTNRELFDIVTCRAVSNLNIILELSISLLKINGLFIPLKASVDEELNESKEKMNKLGYKLIKKNEYILPIEQSKRTILIFEKIKKTDLKYPRNYNLIKKN